MYLTMYILPRRPFSATTTQMLISWVVETFLGPGRHIWRRIDRGLDQATDHFLVRSLPPKLPRHSRRRGSRRRRSGRRRQREQLRFRQDRRSNTRPQSCIKGWRSVATRIRPSTPGSSLPPDGAIEGVGAGANYLNAEHLRNSWRSRAWIACFSTQSGLSQPCGSGKERQVLVG